MPVDVVGVVDRVAGDAIERLTNDHHVRRLGKLGRAAQRMPPDDGRLWAAGVPPPRAGNTLDVLIEGAAYFPALAQAIRGARHSVLIAGWCITPGFALLRDEPPVLLRNVLGEAAESVGVRVLLWAGAPVPVFSPRRSSVRDARDELVRGTRIKAALDANERPMHCHHEKLVVIDDEVAFVGGIDLTDLGGDRYDTPEHPARGRLGWHDVASRLRGPAVADVAPPHRCSAGMRSPASACKRRRPTWRAPAMSSYRSCARSPRSSTTSRRVATFGSSRRTCAPCAPRSI